MKLNKYILVITFLSFFNILLFSQSRERRFHERGMIRETLYNTGEIQRSWIICKWPGQGISLFEWPKYSETIIDGQYYHGHHLAHGAGVYLSGNLRSKHTKDERIYSFCGGTGERHGTQRPFMKYSFPISMEKIENFPLLENGDLNPDYNPNEAEEIIVAKWATNIGVTVTRTSRVWSYPDYDDMIIYEYMLEYTGDTDGIESTIEMDKDGDGKPDEDLVDFLFHINHSNATSMMGFNRWYPPSRGENYIGWYYGEFEGIYRQDLRYTFDPDYWLLFNTTIHTTSADSKNEWWAFKPEPDPELFVKFAETGLNGGGLLGAATPGYCMLYWDSKHLASVNPDDPEKDPTLYNLLKDGSGNLFEYDENGHIKQPWNMKTATPRSSIVKVKDRACDMDERWWTIYGKAGIPEDVPSDGNNYVLPKGREWKGRARFEWYETYNGTQAIQGFGPYILKPGETLEFAYAQVVGYNGTAGKKCLGGQQDNQFFNIRSLHRPIILNERGHDTDLDSDTEIDTVKVCDDYLAEFGYPDHINSSVITVNQVAHKAHEAYTGKAFDDDDNMSIPEVLSFPEDNKRPSENVKKYTNMKIPVPAPFIETKNTTDGKVEILWKRAVENFSVPNLQGTLKQFYIFRSIRKNGPWDLLDSVKVGEKITENGLYRFVDNDKNFRVGTKKYYSVTSVDNKRNQSGKTNVTLHEKNVGAEEKLGKIYVVPNPFHIKSGFADQDKVIKFYGLPAKCKIRIFSFAGQLIETIDHDVDVTSDSFFQVTRNNQDLASGIYFYVVTDTNGDKTTGKFVIIK